MIVLLPAVRCGDCANQFVPATLPARRLCEPCRTRRRRGQELRAHFRREQERERELEWRARKSEQQQ